MAVENASLGVCSLTRGAGYRLLCVGIGLLLLTAATLKAHQLLTEPALGQGILHWRPLLIGAVEFEIFLGLWLISGAYARAFWWTTLLCFAGFAHITLYRALTGEESCGCLGTVGVNPWWMFLLDTTIVASLICLRPGERPTMADRRLDRQRLAVVAALTLIVGMPAGAALVHYEPALLALSEDTISGNSFVLLEPETWVGAKFPLVSHIDIGHQLTRGEWAVLFYQHGCPHCGEELVRLAIACNRS